MALYKLFTLSVQEKYGNHTRVYKGTYVEGFNFFFKIKNWLAYFPFCKDGGHSSQTFLDDTLILLNFFFYLGHVDWMTYRTNDEYEANLGLIFIVFP